MHNLIRKAWKWSQRTCLEQMLCLLHFFFLSTSWPVNIFRPSECREQGKCDWTKVTTEFYVSSALIVSFSKVNQIMWLLFGLCLLLQGTRDKITLRLYFPWKYWYLCAQRPLRGMRTRSNHTWALERSPRCIKWVEKRENRPPLFQNELCARKLF